MQKFKARKGCSAGVPFVDAAAARSPCQRSSPTPMGTRARRSGSANVFVPSPPYIVPRSEKSAVLSRIGMVRPSHGSQFWGIASAAMMRISPRYPSMIIGASLWRCSVLARSEASIDERRVERREQEQQHHDAGEQEADQQVFQQLSHE